MLESHGVFGVNTITYILVRIMPVLSIFQFGRVTTSSNAMAAEAKNLDDAIRGLQDNTVKEIE